MLILVFCRGYKNWKEKRIIVGHHRFEDYTFEFGNAVPNQIDISVDNSVDEIPV